eukprot:3391292-Amphidinium_carterae.1
MCMLRPNFPSLLIHTEYKHPRSCERHAQSNTTIGTSRESLGGSQCLSLLLCVTIIHKFGMPSYLAAVAVLRTFYFHDNILRGMLPDSGLRSLSHVQELWAGHPEGNMETLYYSPLDGGKIEVEVPRGNRLHGPLPATFSDMTSLKYLSLSQASLTGAIPGE